MPNWIEPATYWLLFQHLTKRATLSPITKLLSNVSKIEMWIARRTLNHKWLYVYSLHSRFPSLKSLALVTWRPWPCVSSSRFRARTTRINSLKQKRKFTSRDSTRVWVFSIVEWRQRGHFEHQWLLKYFRMITRLSSWCIFAPACEKRATRQTL